MAKLVIQVDDSQATRALAQITAQAKKTGVEVKVLSTTFGGTSKEIAKADRAFNRLAAQLDPTIAKTQRLEKAQTLLGHALKRGTIDQKEHNRLLRLANQETTRAGRGYAAAAASLRSYLLGFASIGAAVQGLRSLAEAQMQLERIQARLRVAAGGDSAIAGLDFEFVSGKAKELGLNLQSTASAYSALAVATRGTALEGEGTRKVFSGVATAAAAVGLSASQTELALKALEQMVSKGTVSMEELRRQLGDQIPGAFQAAARAMGVSTAEFDRMVRSGEVMAVDLLPKLAREWEEFFGNEGRANVDRMTGSVENFNTSLFELQTEGAKFIDFVGIIHSITEALQGWTAALEALEEKHISLGQAAKETFSDLGSRVAGEGMNWFWSAMFGDGLGKTLSGVDPNIKKGFIAPSGPLSGFEHQTWFAKLAKEIAAGQDRLDPGAMQGALERVFGSPVDPKKLKDYEDAIKKIAKIEKDRADRIENLNLLAWERSFDAPFELIDIGDRIDYQALGEDANRSFSEGWNAAGADLDIFPAPALDESVKVASESFDELRENFIENFQRATGDVFYDFLQTGTLTFESLWDTFKDLAFRAIAEAAAKLATLKLAQSTGGGGGFGGLLGGMGLNGLAGWGTRLFGAGGGASGLYGPTAAGGNLAGGGGALGGLLPLAAVAAFGAYFKHQSDSRSKKMYQSGASVNFANGQVQAAIGASRLRDSAGLAAQGIMGLLDEMQSATGLFITGMEAVSVSIRNDKKAFRVGDQIFSNLQDAVLAAAKKAFLNADLSGELDPAIRQFIERFQGEAAELGEGVRFIQQVMDEGSGLSALGQQIKGFAAEIQGVYQQLLALGIDAAEAQRLSGDWGVQGFLGRRRQITGETESEEQIRARLEGEAELYNAELELYRAQLEGRKATLEAQLEIGVAELTFKKEFVDGEFRIFRAEAEGMEGYLGARAQFAERQAELWRAELAAIDKTLDALGDLDINLGDIKIPKIGGSLGGGRSSRRANLIDRWESAMERLIDAVQDARLGESTTGLTLRERVSTAYSDFQSLLGAAQGGNLSAAEGLPDALRTVLDLAKQYTGGGSGLDFLGLGDGTFRSFFDLLTGTAEEFALGPRPGKIREGNVVFDRRFHEAQERQIAEAQALRQQEGTQLKAVIQTTNDTAAETRETNRLLRKLTQGVDRITRVA